MLFAQDAAEDRESLAGLHSVRLSGPASLGVYLGDKGALKTNVPTPAPLRARRNISDDTLDSLDPLETSMLLDKVCKRVAPPAITRAAPPPNGALAGSPDFAALQPTISANNVTGGGGGGFLTAEQRDAPWGDGASRGGAFAQRII